jgi:hypothetical protein
MIPSLISSLSDKPQGIFGVPLNVSIKYANVAISLTNDNGESFVYGYVPIVIAKCGVFLKEKGMQRPSRCPLSNPTDSASHRCRRHLSPQRIGQAHQGPPGNL